MSGKFLFLPIAFELIMITFCAASQAQSYQYFRIGNKADAQTSTTPGIAMMGGGDDLDEAFRWLCGRANGGDFLILRARGDDDYNAYVNDLCKAHSVATLIIPDRESALQPAVAEIIRRAEAVFIAGGDQALYVQFWRNTPVEDAINDAIAQGKPIGGTSAGLAILGQFVYGSLNDAADGPDLTSVLTLPDPYFYRVTLVRDFLDIPLLQNTITDSHFATRDRMGRTLAFLARIMQDGWSKDPSEIAVDEKSAVLVDDDGKAVVVGPGKGAYFLRPQRSPAICKRGVPLTFQDVSVYRAGASAHFDLKTWKGDGGVQYSLSVQQGVVHSTQASGQVY